MAEITDLLARVQDDQPGARDALFAAAYPELRQLAHSRLYHQGGRNSVLDTTALVHESYLRFVRAGRLRAQERRAFFAFAAQVMRSVIVDLVRERQAQCRGGGEAPLTLQSEADEPVHGGEPAPEVLALHQALARLAAAEPRLAQVVEMRYFGGYSEAEIADTLQLSERTVRRDWDKARLLLTALLA